MGNIQLKRSHKYYTQIICQVAMAKAQLCYFVVWISKDLTVELIEPNDTHYQNVENLLSIFFRSHIFPILLGYKELSFCAKCAKVLLEQNEIEKGQDEIDHNSVQCDHCMCWYHYRCQALQLKDVEALVDNWYCNLCLRSQEGNI